MQIDHDKQVVTNEQLKEDLQNQQNLIEANEQYYYQKIQNIEAQCQQREQLLNQLQEEMKNEMEDAQHYQKRPNSESIVSANSNAGGDAGDHAQERMIQERNRNNVYLHQKVLTAKQEIQRSKNEAVNESMMFLKRRVAELERTNNELGN